MQVFAQFRGQIGMETSFTGFLGGPSASVLALASCLTSINVTQGVGSFSLVTKGGWVILECDVAL